MHVDCRHPIRKGYCHGCDGPLPKHRRSWCSSDCERDVLQNHVWGMARWACLKRDNNRCVICGQNDRDDRAREYLRRHGKSILEVNHIQPVNGNRKSVSCQNHLDNLETLCHDCHVAVTKQQREAGLLRTTVRHWIQILRLPSGVTIFCVRCSLTIEAKDWVAKRREECPAGTKKSQRKPLRKRGKRR